jgi:hypothetical protein
MGYDRMKMAIHLLSWHKFSMLVLDDGDKIKNMFTENCESASQITEHRMVLSGLFKFLNAFYILIIDRIYI